MGKPHGTEGPEIGRGAPFPMERAARSAQSAFFISKEGLFYQNDIYAQQECQLLEFGGAMAYAYGAVVRRAGLEQAMAKNKSNILIIAVVVALLAAAGVAYILRDNAKARKAVETRTEEALQEEEIKATVENILAMIDTVHNYKP